MREGACRGVRVGEVKKPSIPGFSAVSGARFPQGIRERFGPSAPRNGFPPGDSLFCSQSTVTSWSQKLSKRRAIPHGANIGLYSQRYDTPFGRIIRRAANIHLFSQPYNQLFDLQHRNSMLPQYSKYAIICP